MTTQTVKQTNRPIRLGKVKVCPGYFPGMRQPALVAEIALVPFSPSPQRLGEITSMFTAALPDFAARSLLNCDDMACPVGLIAALYESLLRKAYIPILSESQIKPGDQPQDRVTACFPILDKTVYPPCLDALNWATRAVDLCVAGQSISPLEPEMTRVLKGLAAIAPEGINSRRFIETASWLAIPWKKQAGNVYRFGTGARSRLFDSSYTEATPVIGARTARDKQMTAQLLHAAGLPGPRHALARDPDHAVRLAQQLGYPVVIKPADADGGAGVTADLTIPKLVKQAFASARSISRRVLVEKHFEGNDYRLQVLHDEVFWVSHRMPGGVTGDGSRNIRELLAVANADPRRGPRGSNALLKHIDLDEEALALLARAGLTPESVPAEGEFVRLRRTANVASGGMPVPALEGAHPDNLELAVRAASLLRLDLAGIDLLIPDIGRSWLESGALICEINAQPQLSSILIPYLLDKLVPGNGRVPVLVILGQPPDWFGSILDELADTGRGLGVFNPEGIFLDGRKIQHVPDNPFIGCEALLGHARVQFAVFCLDDTGLMETGFPLERFDGLILGEPGTSNPDQWRQFAGFLAQLCTGEVFLASAYDWSTRPEDPAIENARPLEEVEASAVLTRLLEGI